MAGLNLSLLVVIVGLVYVSETCHNDPIFTSVSSKITTKPSKVLETVSGHTYYVTYASVPLDKLFNQCPQSEFYKVKKQYKCYNNWFALATVTVKPDGYAVFTYDKNNVLVRKTVVYYISPDGSELACYTCSVKDDTPGVGYVLSRYISKYHDQAVAKLNEMGVKNGANVTSCLKCFVKEPEKKTVEKTQENH